MFINHKSPDSQILGNLWVPVYVPCASVSAVFKILFAFGLTSLTSYIVLLKPNSKGLHRITYKYLTLN